MTKPFGSVFPAGNGGLGAGTPATVVTSVTSSIPVFVLGEQRGTVNSPTLFSKSASEQRGVASGLTVKPGGRSTRRVLMSRSASGSLIGLAVVGNPEGSTFALSSVCWIVYWVKPMGGCPPAVL